MSKNILIKNFSALTVMQMVQYIAPLIVLPYLVRVIGPAKFGVVSFAHAVAYYFSLLPEIGATLYAPREVALIRDDARELSGFVSGILALKILVLIMTLILYFVLISIVPRFRSEAWVFVFSAGYIIGECFIPVWFFQGIEKMINITIGVFIIRVLALIMIFVFIRREGDYVLVPLINSVSLLVGVVFMYMIVFLREGMSLCLPGLGLLKRIMTESFPLFVSNLVKNLYAGVNIVVLGFFASNTVVGYYSAAERLIRVGMGLINQLGNVFYPYTSRMLKVSEEKGLASIRTGFVVGMLLSIPASILVITYAETIVNVMLGNDFKQSILPLKIMGTLFFVMGLGGILGVQVLLPLGRRLEYMMPVVGGFLLNLVLVVLLSTRLYEVGAAIACVIAQIVVTLWTAYYIKGLGVRVLDRPVSLKLLALGLVLTAFAGFSMAAGINTFISIIIFCLLFICLTVALRIVDIRNLTIQSQGGR